MINHIEVIGDFLVNPLKSKAYKRLDRHLGSYEQFYWNMLGGLAFGPLYSGYSAVTGMDHLIKKGTLREKQGQRAAGTAAGIAFALAHDRWAKQRGLGTLAGARTGLPIHIGKYGVPHVLKGGIWVASRVTPPLVLASSVYEGVNLTRNIAAGSMGTTVGTSYSAKPSWLPLPIWWLLT